MLAANIWHWWIGVVLTLVVIGAVVGLGFWYMKAVSSKKYEPGASRRRRQSSDL